MYMFYAAETRYTSDSVKNRTKFLSAKLNSNDKWHRRFETDRVLQIWNRLYICR